METVQEVVQEPTSMKTLSNGVGEGVEETFGFGAPKESCLLKLR